MNWSERELEDAIWDDPGLVWPADNFYMVGRQITLTEGRLDLLGMLETAGGRRVCVIELKARKADGRDLVQLLSYMGIVEDQMRELPERASSALDPQHPVFGLLVAPGFSRRLHVAVSYVMLDVELVDVLTLNKTRAPTPCYCEPKFVDRPPSIQCIEEALCNLTWTPAQIKTAERVLWEKAAS